MKKIILILLFLASCGDSSTVSPTTTTSTVPPPEPPPPVDITLPFTFDGIGFSAFAGARADCSQWQQAFNEAQGILGPTTYARVCAEVQSWPSNGWLPRGVTAFPFDETAPAAVELRNTLECGRQITGSQFLVMGICNLKEDGTSPENRKKWITTVATIASDFQNVAIEVVNEYRHPRSNVSRGEVKDLIRTARDACPDCLIGTDAGIQAGGLEVYDPALLSLVDFPSVHPPRDPRPSRSEIESMVSRSGGFLVLSETTAFNDLSTTDQSCSGLRTCDPEEIVSYLIDCNAVTGCRFVYHSICGLGWPDTCSTPGIIPELLNATN